MARLQQQPVTTADIPAKFLKAALLVGHIPQKSLDYDPRVSYAVYVPQTHYQSGMLPHDTEKSRPGKLPLLAYIHGTLRDTSAIKTDLPSFADSAGCAVAAPLFPSGIDGPNDLDSYKMLRSETLRSDLAFLAMLDEIAYRWPGIETDKVFVMGFSGGGQFVHRLVYLYPERIAGASVGAPGRITRLDNQLDWPAGIANTEALFSRSVNLELVRRIPIQLVIGSDDLEVHGGKEFWEWVKENLQAHEKPSAVKYRPQLAPMEQGRGDTIRQLQAEWKESGIEARLDVVPGAAHAAGGPIRQNVLQFLRPLIQKLGHE
jgi:pimeloyl-ACP methyl ester carboxylesterase